MQSRESCLCLTRVVVDENLDIEIAELQGVMERIQGAVRYAVPRSHQAYIGNALLNLAVSEIVREVGAQRTATMLIRLVDSVLELVERHYPTFLTALAEQGKSLPEYVQREFEDYLRCGRLEHGFLRVRCEQCHEERLVAFSCKHRGFCPSCGVRRMVESAARLVDEILPRERMRQWVLSVPFALRFLFATHPVQMGQALAIAYRAIATHPHPQDPHSPRSDRVAPLRSAAPAHRPRTAARSLAALSALHSLTSARMLSLS